MTPILEEKPGPYQLTVRYAGDDARAPSADPPADGIAGRMIDFYAGAELLGSATTDEDGVATFEPPKQKGKKERYEGRFDGDELLPRVPASHTWYV